MPTTSWHSSPGPESGNRCLARQTTAVAQRPARAAPAAPGPFAAPRAENPARRSGEACGRGSGAFAGFRGAAAPNAPCRNVSATRKCRPGVAATGQHRIPVGAHSVARARSGCAALRPLHRCISRRLQTRPLRKGRFSRTCAPIARDFWLAAQGRGPVPTRPPSRPVGGKHAPRCLAVCFPAKQRSPPNLTGRFPVDYVNRDSRMISRTALEIHPCPVC